MSYNPSIHGTANRPIGFYGSNPADARSYYYDSSTKSYRPFNSTAEALTYIGTSDRDPSYRVYIKTSGVVDAYWFKDGTADSDLVKFAATAAASTFTADTLNDL